MSSVNPSYRRVSSQDASSQHSGVTPSSSSSSEGGHGGGSRRAAPQQTPAPPPTPGRSSERLWDKLIALAWMALAVLVARYSNLYAMLHSPSEHRLKTTPLHLAAACGGTDLLLLAYLYLYLPYGKGLSDASAWAVYCPRVAPAALAFAVLGTILLVRALWPVWGCLTPLLLATQPLGAAFALHWVPWPRGSG